MREDEKGSQEYDGSSLNIKSSQEYGDATSDSEIAENGL